MNKLLGLFWRERWYVVLYVALLIGSYLYYSQFQNLLFCYGQPDCQFWSEPYGQLIINLLLGWVLVLCIRSIVRKSLRLKSLYSKLVLVGVFLFIVNSAYFFFNGVKTTNTSILIHDLVSGINVSLERDNILLLTKRWRWASLTDGGRRCVAYYYIRTSQDTEVVITNASGSTLFSYLHSKWGIPYHQSSYCD